MAQDLGDPRRQEKLPGGYATQGQAVSAPYAEANMAAAEKTNPMNAESQMPGKEKSFLDGYIGGLAGKALGSEKTDILDPFLGVMGNQLNRGNFGGALTSGVSGIAAQGLGNLARDLFR